MKIEIEENGKITALEEIAQAIVKIHMDLISNHSVDISSHAKKIEKLIDNAIKKERVKILEAEIEKVKKGGN